MCFRQCENVTNVSALAQLFLVLLLVSVSIQRIPLEAVPGECGLATREGAGGGRESTSAECVCDLSARCPMLSADSCVPPCLQEPCSKPIPPFGCCPGCVAPSLR